MTPTCAGTSASTAGATNGDGYTELLAALKERVATARVRAALSVNRKVVLLYWSVGRDILNRQTTEGWGTKVIDRLAADLRQALPEMKGFSARSLKYMRAFAEAWPDAEFVQQVAAQLPWGHSMALLDAASQLGSASGTPERRSSMAGAAPSSCDAVATLQLSNIRYATRPN